MLDHLEPGADGPPGDLVDLLTAILRELRAIRSNLKSSPSQPSARIRPAETTAKPATIRQRKHREALKQSGMVFVRGRAIMRNSDGVSREGVTGVTPLPSDSYPKSFQGEVGFQTENLYTHKTGCHASESVTPCLKIACDISVNQAIKALEPASLANGGPLRLFPVGSQALRALDVVVQELASQGVGLEDYQRAADWIRSGGLAWRDKVPPDVFWLASPKGLERIIRDSRADYERVQREVNRRKRSVREPVRCEPAQRDETEMKRLARKMLERDWKEPGK